MPGRACEIPQQEIEHPFLTPFLTNFLSMILE